MSAYSHRMSIDEFDAIISPLYRQFAGYMDEEETAENKHDRYRLLSGLPPEALRQAVDRCLESEVKMPPIALLRSIAQSWLSGRMGGPKPPQMRSELCPTCRAVHGEVASGRLAVLHEASCALFNPFVRPVHRDATELAP